MSVCSGSGIVSDSTSASLRIEQAELDARRVLGEEREVDAGAVPGRSQRIRGTGPDSQAVLGHKTGSRMTMWGGGSTGKQD